MSRYVDIDRLEPQQFENSEVELGVLAYDYEGVQSEPYIDIVRCGECVYYDPPHVDDKGKRIEYKDLPKEAFDKLGTGLVNLSYGINVGGRCCVDYNCGYAEDKRVYRAEDDFCSRGKERASDDTL